MAVGCPSYSLHPNKVCKLWCTLSIFTPYSGERNDGLTVGTVFKDPYTPNKGKARDKACKSTQLWASFL